MDVQKPSIPKGTRDFGPNEMVRRNYIFNIVKNVFEKYGYLPLETPAMENLSTLLGKYGEEGDRLLFRILNSGDFLSKVSDQERNLQETFSLVNHISEKGLKYDLTVPFARYVVQHRNEITFPFKRYQIQPVWRADRPQKGRYREFYQCDVDVIGSNSLLNEVELVQIIDAVFNRLKINTVVKINNRKILAGIAEAIGEADRIIDITVAIDKLDKIGLEKVNAEMIGRGISESAGEKLQPILLLQGTTSEKLIQIEKVIGETEVGTKGISEMKTLFGYLDSFNLNTEVELDLTLARGLNYYTGAIFEVKSKDVQIGSICGGGRYDDLTGIFGMPDVSGVGISFGADRIFDVLMELDKFPPESSKTTQLFFVNFGNKEAKHCLPLLAKARKEGIIAELYPQAVKIKKQMSYANKLNIPYVVIIGEEEIKSGLYSLKNMHSGEQDYLSFKDIIEELKSK